MNKLAKKSVIAALFLTAAPVQAAFSESVFERWQMKRMFQPAQSQLMLEQKGKVFIYEGIKDNDVSRVMDEEFERIESMMFIGTVVTDKAGKPKSDPLTGLVMKEDDGC
jgi:hypothetical protein